MRWDVIGKWMGRKSCVGNRCWWSRSLKHYDSLFKQGLAYAKILKYCLSTRRVNSLVSNHIINMFAA